MLRGRTDRLGRAFEFGAGGGPGHGQLVGESRRRDGLLRTSGDGVSGDASCHEYVDLRNYAAALKPWQDLDLVSWERRRRLGWLTLLSTFWTMSRLSAIPMCCCSGTDVPSTRQTCVSVNDAPPPGVSLTCSRLCAASPSTCPYMSMS